MKNTQIRQYEMLVRLRDFGAAQGSRFPEATRANKAFASIGEAVNQLRDYAVSQLALKRHGAKARAAARADLVAMLDSISRTARVIQEEEPSFPNTFLMPKRRGAQAVLTAAHLFARDIEPFAKQFVDHAMAETFVADFKRLLDAYDEAVRSRETGKGQSAAALVSIEAGLAAGLAAARKLDVIVANHLGDDRTLVAEWERDRRVGYRRKTQPPAPPAVAPTGSTGSVTTMPPTTVAVAEADVPVTSTPAVVPIRPVTSTVTAPDDQAA